jgi:hypothetical protein
MESLFQQVPSGYVWCHTGEKSGDWYGKNNFFRGDKPGNNGDNRRK